jgi:hypothetical protein
MSERRYWRSETEKLLADLAMIRDAEVKKLMIQPVVIQVTEDERKRIEERILDQIIQPVDFSTATSAPDPNVTMEDLLRTVEECERQVAIGKENAELLKALERLAYGYSIELLPMQAATFDLREYCRFRLLDERMTAEALAVYEPATRTE